MLALQEALRQQFNELRSRNQAFSLRAYARRLQVNSGVLSSIMSGQRRVSNQWLSRVVPRMGLPPETAAAIQNSFRLKDLSKQEFKTTKATLLLRSDEFRMISENIHFALLALFDLTEFKSNLNWMATRLGTSEKTIRLALERLQRLGLVEKKARGLWQSTGKRLRTSEGISDSAIKRFHEAHFEDAKKYLYEVDVNDRDYLCSTLAVNPKHLPLAKKLVREFLEKLEGVFGEDEKTEVYRIGIQIFPVTKLKSRKEPK